MTSVSVWSTGFKKIILKNKEYFIRTKRATRDYLNNLSILINTEALF